MGRDAYMGGLPGVYWYPDRYAQQAESFFKAYELEHAVECSSPPATEFQPRAERTCRFCGRRRPFTTFTDEAHMISALLGNKHLLSDSECDECNAVFSKYESHLANFLGVSRTLLSIKGRDKIPKFKSPDKQFEMESWIDGSAGPIVELMRSEGNHPSIQFDRASDIVTVTVKKQSYQPIAVYKAFLKMALSCLPEAYVKEYQQAVNYALGNQGIVTGGFTYLLKYTMSYTFMYEKPVVMIFKKRDPGTALFTHIFVLFALNSIFEIPVPLYEKDAHLYGGQVNLLRIPPLFTNDYAFPIETIKSQTYNLSSHDLMKDDMDSFSFNMPLSGLPENFDTSLIKGVNFSGRYPIPPPAQL
ncbi:MAG TPA: hypothetical protein VHE34_21270 [Puia sp.]|uniref:hypothetical protein n=1 Tax=Puia sp. TaxID=2045100 RepID=UPI002CC86406|nr:hypothetical protein [Puia sp.]HVU97775.1 hypothetical protein [Puia sp.]